MKFQVVAGWKRHNNNTIKNKLIRLRTKNVLLSLRSTNFSGRSTLMITSTKVYLTIKSWKHIR